MKGEDVESKREEEVTTKVVDEFPEGGLRAWLALAGSTLVLTCTFSISNSFGTFLNYYKQVSFLFPLFFRKSSHLQITDYDRLLYSINSSHTIHQRSVGLDRLISSLLLVQLSSQVFFSTKDSKYKFSHSHVSRSLLTHLDESLASDIN